MTAQLLDGKLVASVLRKEITHQIQAYRLHNEHTPGLAVIQIGEDPASTIYVNHKRRACADVGIQSFAYDLPETIREKEVLHLIEELNQNPLVHGILVQFPLPKHISSSVIVEHINPEKDVDGFHPYNLGRLAQGRPLLRPCTPYGIIQLLHHYQLPLKSQHVVIIGISTIVGRPMALECLLAEATVTQCHRETRHLAHHVKSADVLVVATGTQDVIPTSWLQPHQIVLDVGIHRLPNGNVRGDIDFISAKKKVAWITPVPGGVGPLTICTLLQNTVYAAYHSDKRIHPT